MPKETIAVLLDHGVVVADSIEQELAEARRVMDDLERFGVRFTEIAARLEEDGVRKFTASFNRSIEHIRESCGSADVSPGQGL
jgi:transaldolase